ncbi:hypothetical protein FRC03_001031 [Tulasnella sp. 419]|nr:hypothetical protein FRC02_011382 [Tulasnella sp. 418]KAG8965003.1 hypothetical protein FRC03_001031 [Tulasnella sp. 419]
MALYSPMPAYPNVPALAVSSSSTSSSSNTTPSPTAPPSRELPPQRPQQSPRHLSRSEKMLMAALQRADGYERSSDADTDYYPQAEITWPPRSAGVSPSRSYKRHHHKQLSSSSGATRSPSPAASRFVERDRISRRRTPSPSPHPYLSTRQQHPQPPAMNRTLTAPTPLHNQPGHYPSRPGTPSHLNLPRRSSSPAAPMHSRAASPSASYHLSRVATAISSELDAGIISNIAGTSSTLPGHRSRGPSVSSISRPIPSDHSRGPSYSQGGANPPQRAPSIGHASTARQSRSPVSPSRSTKRLPRTAMITPPPSPPLEDPSSIGLGRPSETPAAPSKPCFDARSASLALKDQNGYVSFCDIEGLGEPEGVDGYEDDDDGSGDNARGRGKWWEVWRK